MSGSSSSNNSWGMGFSESKPTTPEDLYSYFQKLNREVSGGRLENYAKNGTSNANYTPQSASLGYNVQNQDVTYTPQSASLGYNVQNQDVTYRPVSQDVTYRPVSQDVTYHSVSNDDLKKLGGAGATRKLEAERSWQKTLDEIMADPRLSIYQSGYRRQESNRDYASNLDAIAKEVEAALASAALDQASRDQAGRQAQGEFDTTQAVNERAGRQAQGEFDTTQAVNERAGRQAQGEYDTTQAQNERAGRQAQAEYTASEASKEQAGRQAQGEYNTTQSKLEQAGRQTQAEFDANQFLKAFEAKVANNALTSQDMATLAQIFFGGKGQSSKSNNWNTSNSSSNSYGISL